MDPKWDQVPSSTPRDGQSFLREKAAQTDQGRDQGPGSSPSRRPQHPGCPGDTSWRTPKGDFDSIGELWGNLIINMIAQASAAQLNKYLFGDIFSGGSNSGAIGANFSDVFKFLGFMATGRSTCRATAPGPFCWVSVWCRLTRTAAADGAAERDVQTRRTEININGNADAVVIARALDRHDEATRAWGDGARGGGLRMTTHACQKPGAPIASRCACSRTRRSSAPCSVRPACRWRTWAVITGLRHLSIPPGILARRRGRRSKPSQPPARRAELRQPVPPEAAAATRNDAVAARRPAGRHPAPRR